MQDLTLSFILQGNFIILLEVIGLLQIVLPKYHLELWPGYVTSIRQHENDILMCSEISHKVMRQDTVLELLTDCVRRGERNYKVSLLHRFFLQ